MKKELKWRLSDLPSGGEVADLVGEGVITKEEARSILFNEGEDKGKKLKELEEEVKFLRDLCDKLAAKSNGWTTIVREYHDYRPKYPTWYASYGGVVNAVSTTTLSSNNLANLTSGTGMAFSQNLSQTKMLGKLN
jgi:hypothetical protein